MKFVVKAGREPKDYYFSESLIQKKMEETLKEHPHLCATCSSTACGKKRGIYSEFVYSAINTLGRDYVFGCIAYRKRKQGEQVIDYNLVKCHKVSPDTTYTPPVHSITHPRVKELVRKMK